MTNDTLIIDIDGDLVLLFDPEECSSSRTDDTWTDADSSEDDSRIIDAESSNGEFKNLFELTDISRIILLADKPSGLIDASWVELKQVRMLVSSKNMSVASPVFKAMLQANSHEGIELKKTGKAGLSLRDGNSKICPFGYQFANVHQIALLCDKYQMPEVAYAFTPAWKISAGHDSVSGKDIPRWIFIAWTFNMADVLEEITKGLALTYTGNGIQKLFSMTILPIPHILLDELESSRQHAVAEVVDMFDYAIQRYQGNGSRCSIRTKCGEDRVSYRTQCDAMILGMLLKGAIEQKIYPLPTKPYKEWSFSILEKKIKCIKPTSLCAAMSFIPDVDCDQDHGVSKIMTSWIRNTAGEVTGLQSASLKKDASPEIQWPIR